MHITVSIAEHSLPKSSQQHDAGLLTFRQQNTEDDYADSPPDQSM